MAMNNPERLFDLSEADLIRANLSGADLNNADLSETDLSLADISGANLSKANLSSSLMSNTHFREVEAINTNLNNSWMSDVDIVNCDISQVRGLETVRDFKPNSIGIDTLEKTFRSFKKTSKPESEKNVKTFFMNAGVPRELLEDFPRILAEVKYMTAFIGYGEPDVNFAEKLHNDLIKNGISCWLYKTDYTVGEKTWREICNRRREAEKFIVLCSTQALVRDGLLKELEEQVDEDVEKLVPISLDEL